MDSDLLTSMYAYIVRGAAKDACPYVTDEESSGLFDKISGEVTAMRTEHGEAFVFEVPSEIPAVPDQPPATTDTPPTDAPPNTDEEEDV